MNEEDIEEYVQEKLHFFEEGAELCCKEIGDGNLNYVFRLWEEKTGKSIVIKQAGKALRISDEMTLNVDRGKIESQILGIQEQLCPGLVPEVYQYDPVMCAILMEDMSGHEMMRTGMVNHHIYPEFADQISTFLVNSLLLTTDVVVNHKDKKELVRNFINPELCEITEDLVFSEPYLDYNERNQVFPPNREFIEKEIYGDEQLHLEAAKLKFEFMNNAQSLIHGDLHTGSVFINKEHTFVFDPEFACYGPMGYDIGNVLANLFFGWCNGDATILSSTEKEEFCGWCLDSIRDIVDQFIEKYHTAFDSHVKDEMAKTKGFKEYYLRQILSYTAGTVGLELIRRIVGMAKVKDITNIEDMEKRARAEKICLTLAKDCIKNRESFQSGQAYSKAIRKAVEAFGVGDSVLPEKKSILDYDTVDLDEENHALVIIDQTKLPSQIEILSLTKQTEIWDAIYLLQVRGAPAIGVAAAIGIYLAARDIVEEMKAKAELDEKKIVSQEQQCQLSSAEACMLARKESFELFYEEFKKAKAYLDSARPTAVNLSWALNRMEQVVLANKEKPIDEIVELLHKEAVEIREEDIRVCKSIGEYGLSLVKPGDGLLTHCNAGQLATVRYGTATAPIYLGQERGYHFKVFADETRPLLQGARLTAFELQDSGLDVTLICDNMSGTVMRKGWVNAVFVGCDRIAANGDTANKIGTSMAALAAKRYGIPFYVCAPTSTIDMDTPTGDDIPIEERKPEEVTDMWYEKKMAPEGVKVFNPAFDITDHDLIAGIVTEYGVARPPYTESLKEIFVKKEISRTVKKVMKEL
jgi:5-methylthioribose kinase